MAPAEPVPTVRPDAASPVLRIQGFGRRYGETVAVRGLDLELFPGEILGLVGPNGAGKTTTLRSIAGILPIQAGRIEVAGHDLEREELAAKRELVWVPDDPKPFDTLTVHEHLEFTGRLYRVAGWRSRAEELLALFDLGAKRDALGSELSRGMRQKLALAMAWLPQPKLALLDEPLSGLDPLGIRAAKRALRDLARAGTAIVLSSHQLSLVEELATRLLMLRGGRKVFEGTLAEARATRSRGVAGDVAATSLEELFVEITTGDGAVGHGELGHGELGNGGLGNGELGNGELGNGTADDAADRGGAAAP